MSFAQGTSESLILGFESSFKTMPGSVIGDKVPVTNPSIKPNRNKFTSNALTGVPQPRPVVLGKVPIEGSFGLEGNPASLMPALKGLFGAPRTSGGIGSTGVVYAQEYGFQAPMLPMYIAQLHADIAQYFLWNGMYLGGAQFSFGREGIMESTFNTKGARQTLSSSNPITSTITDRTPFQPFSYLMCRIKLNGSVVGYSKQIDLNIDRKLGTETAQDQTTEPVVVFSEIPVVDTKIMALFQDAALLNLAAGGTEISIEMWMPSILGYGMLVELPTIVLRPSAATTNGTGLAEVTVEGDVYARGANSGISARNRSRYLATAPALNGLTLTVNPDATGVQTFTFATGDNTIDLIAAKINATATGMVASVERMLGDLGGVLRIDSLTKGPNSSIQVTGGTGNTSVLLGFDTASHVGIDNQSVWITLLTPLAA